MTDNYDAIIGNLARRPEVTRVLEAIERDRDNIVADWVKLVEISAPSGQERERADVFRDMLVEGGIDDFEYDEKGNLLSWYRGSDNTSMVVLDGHLDTVWKAKMPIRARVEDGKLHAPGAIDNTVALVAMLVVLRSLASARLRLHGDLLLAATTFEEVGILGGKSLAQRLKGADIKAYIYIHGGGLRITFGRTMGIRWYRVAFNGPGGHSGFGHENKSAAWPLAEAVARIYREVPLIAEPLLDQELFNVGMLGAADSANAKAAEAWFSIDIRSFSENTCDRMEAKLRAITEEVATECGFTCQWVEIGGHPAFFEPGARETERVGLSIAASRYLGIEPELVERMGGGTAWAAQAGIPVLGHHINTGEGFHRLDEYGDIETLIGGLKRLLLVTMALGGLR